MSDARLNKKYVKETAAEIMTEIDNIVARVKKAKTPAEKKQQAERLMPVWKRMKKLRKDGLASEAREMSSGNIIWKTLRREGYINDVWDTLNDAYNEAMSLK